MRSPGRTSLLRLALDNESRFGPGSGQRAGEIVLVGRAETRLDPGDQVAGADGERTELHRGQRLGVQTLQQAVSGHDNSQVGDHRAVQIHRLIDPRGAYGSLVKSPDARR